MKGFMSSRWMEKARKYVANPKKLKLLLLQLGTYLSKDGLSNVKTNLLLMYHYLQDIVAGRYKGYNSSKLLLVVAVLIYVISPFDLIPDILPTGLLDDSSLIIWALKEVTDELGNYKTHKELKNDSND